MGTNIGRTIREDDDLTYFRTWRDAVGSLSTSHVNLGRLVVCENEHEAKRRLKPGCRLLTKFKTNSVGLPTGDLGYAVFTPHEGAPWDGQPLEYCDLVSNSFGSVGRRFTIHKSKKRPGQWYICSPK